MYRNIFHDIMNGKIYLWETINSKKFKEVINVKYDYYTKDESGKSKIKDIFGIPVIKKSTTQRKNVRTLRESGAYTCETDISEDVKYLHKKYEKVEMRPNMEDFNICNLDIEIASKYEFPKPEQAKYPINLITFYCSRTNEFYTFGTEDYTGREVKNYFYVPNEKEMIEKFILVFRKLSFDIITGWYINNFDIPYIIKRCENLGISKNLSPLNKIIKKKENKTPQTAHIKSTAKYTIAGISCLDYLDLYKKYTKDKRQSYSLEYISQFEINEGKIEYEGTINTLWETDWNKFVEYNVQDVALVNKLNKKLGYIELLITVSYNAMIPFEKAFSSIQVHMGYMLKTLHKKNLVMPDKQDHHEEEFPGAFVYANPGYYKNVVSFDVESLYPHMIMQYNISPETLVTDPIKIEKLRREGNLITTPVGRKKGFMIETQVGTKRVIKKVVFNNTYYDKTKKGIVPQVIEEIFKDRKKFKALKAKATKEGNKDLAKHYDRQQYVRKIMINSLYGVIANKYFHFYNIENAKAITLGGQDLIQFLSESVNDYFKNYFHTNEKYFKTVDEENKIKKDVVILIDTDSNFLSLEEIKEKVAPNEDYLKWANKFVKEFLDPFFSKILKVYAKRFNVPNIIIFEREKIASKMLILAKKKYGMEVLDKEGEIFNPPKIDITGIEVKRTSTPEFCRNNIESVIHKIFETEDKKPVLEFMRGIKKEFKKQPIDKIASPKGISDYDKYAEPVEKYINNGLYYVKGCPIHVRAGIVYNYLNKKYKLQGLPVSNGTKIKYIYTLNENIINSDIVGFIGKYPKKFEEIFKVDYEKQWEKSFQDVIQRIFDVLKWDKIILKINRLEKFFV